MNYWLLKSEPHTWSWEQQRERGEAGEWWDGVRNHQAAKNLRAMKKGDRAFFYHSGKKPCIVGVVEIIAEAKLNPSDPKQTFVMVCVQAKHTFPAPIPLSTIKTHCPEISIARQSRLSVAPVTEKEWNTLSALGTES